MEAFPDLYLDLDRGGERFVMENRARSWDSVSRIRLVMSVVWRRAVVKGWGWEKLRGGGVS